MHALFVYGGGGINAGDCNSKDAQKFRIQLKVNDPRIKFVSNVAIMINLSRASARVARKFLVFLAGARNQDAWQKFIVRGVESERGFSAAATHTHKNGGSVRANKAAGG